MEAPIPKGPLAVRWHRIDVGDLRAGAVAPALVEFENAGAAAWTTSRDGGIHLAYHWLDLRGNPLVWDGIRTPLERPIAHGERVTAQMRIRGPLPPGRYRLAVDLVDEARLWFAEVGNAPLEVERQVLPRIPRALAARGGVPEALAAQEEPLVPEEEAAAIAYLGRRCAPAPDWSRRVLDAHQEGFALVAGAVEPVYGLFRRRPGELAPYAAEGGRRPNFSLPLICPSIVREVDPEWTDDVAGLPAVKTPEDRYFGEPWIFDARILLRAYPA